MSTLRLILADQLSHGISSLNDTQPNDTVLLCETMEDATYVKHHPKKIAFLFAAMRHFAQELQEKNMDVRYIKLTDSTNTGNLIGEVRRAVKTLKVKSIVVTEPSEYRVRKIIESCEQSLGIIVDVRPDERFLCTPEEFKVWATDKKQLRIEYFYREMRKKYKILIEPDGTSNRRTMEL